MSNITKSKVTYINKTLIRLLAGSISLGSAFLIGKTEFDKPLEISKEVDWYVGSVSENMYLNKLYTEINMNSLKEMDIDVLKTDFNDLKSMPNIETITFSNFGYLTDEDKKIISNLKNLKSIAIRYDVSMFNEECYDMSWINSDVEIKINYRPESTVSINGEDVMLNNDLIQLYSYDLLACINKINNGRVKISGYKLESISHWKNKLDSIVLSFDFDENTTDEEKILKIIDYVTDSLEYDPEVYEAFFGDTKTGKTIVYNYSLLGSLYSDLEYGVCANYAALTTALAQEAGVDVGYIVGTHNGNSHGWTQYNGDKPVVVDTTWLDDDIYRGKREAYLNDKNKENKKALYDEVFVEYPGSGYVSEYEINPNTIFEKDKEKEIEYRRIEPNKKYNDEVATRRIKEYIFLMLSSTLFLISKKIYDKKQEKNTK